MQIVQVLQSAEGPVNEPEWIPMQLQKHFWNAFSGSVRVPRVWSLHV